MHRVEKSRTLIHLPQRVEEALKSYVKRTYYAGTRKADFAKRQFTSGDLRFFAKGVAELTRYFTSERPQRPRNYFNRKELRSGYLLYFLPVNALKIQALLQANLPRNFFAKPKRILDLGSGPGTGALGTLLQIAGGHGDPPLRYPEITMVDQNKAILKDGEQLISKLSDKKPQLTVADLSRPLSQFLPQLRYDLIIIANTLNEFTDGDKRLRLVRNLIQRYLSAEGCLLIMEPALRMPTRQLMELRDQIAREEIAWIQAPCLHQADCPMLADNPRDWCHMYWDWQRPAMIAEFDKLVGIRKDYLKASYLLLRPLKQQAEKTKNLWRVVSGPLNSKGKTERLLCGEAALPHLRRLMRLDRDSSALNRDFERAQRGDLILTEVQEKVGKSDRVKRVT